MVVIVGVGAGADVAVVDRAVAGVVGAVAVADVAVAGVGRVGRGCC